MNSESQSSSTERNNENTIQVMFNSITKKINIGNSYFNFLKNVQSKFNINKNDIKNIIFCIVDNRINMIFNNEELYKEIFGKNGNLKSYFNNGFCKAILNYNDIETKCILLEEETRNNLKQLELLNQEIKDLLKQKKQLKYCNEKKISISINDMNKPRDENEELKESLKSNNVIIEKKNDVQSEKPIMHTIIIKRKKDDNWPNNLKLMCVPNDSDIYFKHVNLNVKEEQPITFENGEYIYKKTIGIIFKNYKKIKQTEYFLSAVLKSDTSKFKIDLGNIIVRIV